MQGAHDHARAPPAPAPAAASSLEDRLRGMIISHQQFHQTANRCHSRPEITPPTPPLPPPQYLPPTFNQAFFTAASPPRPGRNGFFPAPLPVVTQMQPEPMFEGARAPMLHPGVRGGSGPPDGSGSAGGSGRGSMKHSSPGRGFRQGGQPHSHRPKSASRRLPPHLSPTPPPPNLDDFPPLGKEIPQENPRSPSNVLAQHADHSRGQYQRHEVDPGNQNTRPNRPWRPHPSHYEQFFADQALALDVFAKGLLAEIAPPDMETSMKHKLLDTLQQICQQLSPAAQLIPFGSLVTGFATASSDIDCVFTVGPHISGTVDEIPADLPSLLEKKLQDNGFDTRLLSRTRVPIIKMVQKPTPESPQEIQCDIGFKNRLAIHNTQLLLCYSRCDARVRQMVLFVKWWAKKRHINSPYRGTLASYGYVLMILHYLINIIQPPVLPNLQLQPIPEGTDDNEVHHKEGETEYNIWFSKDTERIPPSKNTSSLGELLRGFFDYYSYKFGWSQGVISIRTEGGLLAKQDKGWITAKSRPANTTDGSETWEVKDRYLFALEDPFETAHNVGRTCTGHGVTRIRNELRRAMKLIKIRGDRGKQLTQYLCEEAPPERPFVRREDAKNLKDPNSSESPVGKTNEEEAAAELELTHGTLHAADCMVETAVA